MKAARIALTFLGVLSVSVAFAFLFAPRLLVFLPQTLGPDVLYYTGPEHKLVALTIDDSPSVEETDRILTVLDKHEVTATFFVIGVKAQMHETVLERITEGGHEIANHGWDATPSIDLDRDRFARELARTSALLGTSQPKFMRPASGLYTSEIVAEIKAQGMQAVLADVYPADTRIHSPAFFAWYLEQNVRPGSIIVLHDGGDGTGRGDRTAEALDLALPRLKAAGFEFVSLSGLVARSDGGRK